MKAISGSTQDHGRRTAADGDIGVRVAHLANKSQGFKSPDNVTFTPVSISNDYTDFLPSLNMSPAPDGRPAAALWGGVAIARPPLDALVTGFSLNSQGIPPSGGGGNPLLRPFKANQVDLSYEWYFHSESLFAVAAYYKDMKE